MYRNQWAGFDGNPITALLVGDSKIDAIHGAIGGLVRYNQLGQETNLAAKLGYAYRAPVGPGTLQLGLNREFQHKTLEGNWISTSGPDPSIPTATTDYVFDAGFGALFQTNVAHVGVGITHLLESQYDDLYISRARHYYAHAG
jgi:type IX secretion system PorP/SprF family membrane protein